MAGSLTPGGELGMQRTLLDLPDALLASVDDASALNHFAIQHLLCPTDLVRTTTCQLVHSGQYPRKINECDRTFDTQLHSTEARVSSLRRVTGVWTR